MSRRASGDTAIIHRSPLSQLVDLTADTSEVSGNDCQAVMTDHDVTIKGANDLNQDSDHSHRSSVTKTRSLRRSPTSTDSLRAKYCSDGQLLEASAFRDVEVTATPIQSPHTRLEVPEQTMAAEKTFSASQTEQNRTPHTTFNIPAPSTAPAVTRDISPPPPRRRTLPWQTKKNETPTSTPTHTKALATKTTNIPITQPSASKRKRTTDSEADVPEPDSQQTKSPKLIHGQDENGNLNSTGNAWYKDPNTHYNQFCRGYGNLRREQERTALMNQPKPVLMVGGINLLGWMN